MKKYSILLAVVLLVGCVTPTERVNNALDSWLGLNENQLIAQYGVPSGVYHSRGMKFVTFYTSSLGSTVGYSGIPRRYYTRSCSITFGIDEDGIIQTYSWKGNAC